MQTTTADARRGEHDEGPAAPGPSQRIAVSMIPIASSQGLTGTAPRRDRRVASDNNSRGGAGRGTHATTSQRNVADSDDVDAARVDTADSTAAVPDFVLLFTVAVASNFISGLFPAKLKAVMHNVWAKHIVALLFIGLTIVWTEPSLDARQAFFDTMLAYLWFLAMFHMTAAQFLAVVSILVALFVITRLRQQAERRAARPHATEAERHASAQLRRYEIGSIVLAALATVAFTCARLFESHRSAGPEPLRAIPWWDTWELNLIRPPEAFTRSAEEHLRMEAAALAAAQTLTPPTLTAPTRPSGRTR